MGWRGWSTLVAVGCATGGALYWQWQVAPLETAPPPAPRVEFGAGQRASVRYKRIRFVTPLARFHDELFAYLMLQHYRSAPPVAEGTVLMRYVGELDPPGYELLLAFSDDFVEATGAAAQLSARQGAPAALIALPAALGVNYLDQTRFFDSAYNLPVQRKMEELSDAELCALARRFVRFKSATDPRVRSGMEPAPRQLPRARSSPARGLAGTASASADRRAW